ncbi:hypothetical protein BN7_3812 [Wickerhamomyces ciferrii]|uniref:Uncharacterized protein n=1 Tax=Wickerhamomyces ciferrii (strain ATCC 14091 / BCRC 22168 / CBS 111 / JCM 3599 / NBRC 0793 / NRRL Y-1031 F-60-10) TaxID=1206466 RepID=K0KMS1_WICCF|nr:uncharacterized protein BN7_3812 [Wickerhamomyces ciferrii]CCH44251.1 hypothetical protein BN7_3812 [Wickerhamomyces ciferrii]
MVGPEIPEKIQKIRNERLGRNTKIIDEQISDDGDFAGPSLDYYNINEGENKAEEELGRIRLQKAQIENHKTKNIDGNGSKHDSWMSMKPEWAQENSSSSKSKLTNHSTESKQPSESIRPSLLEQHKERRRLEGLDKNEGVKYDSNESLNTEIRKEIFRKASNLNDRFTKGS